MNPCPFCKQDEFKIILATSHAFAIPDGFPLAAGQAVMHLHIHFIPRYAGDLPDPRGGVRWIFPDKAAYWDK